MAGYVKFQCLSQCPNLYWTAEVGIQPHIKIFPCCKTTADSWSCHRKNTLRYGYAKLAMKSRATLFPGWQGSLCAPAWCHIFQYILGVWNLLNATVTNVEILHSAAKSFTFIHFAYRVLHFLTWLWPFFASAQNPVIELQFYELTLLKCQELTRQKNFIIFNTSCSNLSSDCWQKLGKW